MIRSVAAAAALGSLSSRLLGVGTKSRHGSPASGLYGGAQPLGVPGCSPGPPSQPWASRPFLPWDSIFGHTRHYFRDNTITKHVAGGSENQLDELKMRLIALRIYAPYSTAEEILKDPRLDLESLPAVSRHDALECINRYICVLRTVETSVAYFRCLIFLVIGDYIDLSTSPSKLVEILRTRSGFLELDKFDLTSAVENYIQLCCLHCPSSSEASKIELLEQLEQKKYHAMCEFFMTGLDQALFTISSQGTNEWSAAAAERENAKEVSKPKLCSNRKRGKQAQTALQQKKKGRETKARKKGTEEEVKTSKIKRGKQAQTALQQKKKGKEMKARRKGTEEEAKTSKM